MKKNGYITLTLVLATLAIAAGTANLFITKADFAKSALQSASFRAAFDTVATNNIVGPVGSGKFGAGVYALPNGNIVVVDPQYSIPGGAHNVGAVYLYDRNSRAVISTLTGSTASSSIGNGGVTILTNGNYVIGSPNWGTGSVGAATFGNASTGVSGVVSATNSVVGSQPGDYVASRVIPLTNGNYVVGSPNWKNGSAQNAGAATLGDGTNGTVGAVSAANSLVSSTANSYAAYSTIPLTNGNYVVSSPNWSTAAGANVGAATFGSGTTGVSGEISSANSLVGTVANDYIGYLVAPLTNGNYVVGSPDWANGGVDNVGAATFGNGTTGISGPVSTLNSLHGATAGDSIGGGITPLTNGNYVAFSHFWANPAMISGITNSGAATLGNGTTGITGPVTATNSLVGERLRDNVSSGGVTALTNGNYVVSSPIWTISGINVGAATFGNGTTGITGIVSTANSLTGSVVTGVGSANNVSSSGITALSNGNYVVSSSGWENSPTPNVGAVTFADGTTGLIGPVTAANSLIGITANDFVGSRGATALTNGNYVVGSPNWNNAGAQNAGAATFGNGTTGTTGIVSTSNSLVGQTAQSYSNFYVTALANGNYVTSGPNWVNGGAANTGAATFGNGNTGIIGVIAASNSLIGTQADDYVGAQVVALPNNDYVVRTTAFSNGTSVDVGAISYGNGNGGTVGPVSYANSVIGTGNNGGEITFSFDAAIGRLAVGLPAENIVTLFDPSDPPPPPTPTPTATPTPLPGSCPTTITHSSSYAVVPGQTVACVTQGMPFHRAASYWRAFRMSTFGVMSNQVYNVTSVDFGIEADAGGTGTTQPVTVRLYAKTGSAFPTGFPNVGTQIAEVNLDVVDQQGVLNVPLTGTVPAGTTELIMEVAVPDGVPAGNIFQLGGNSAPETGPGYIGAANCGGTAFPRTTAEVGFPTAHYVMGVNGSCPAGTPTPTPTPTVTPTPSPTPVQPVSVSGTVTTEDGRGIRNATVIIFDSSGGQQRVLTNSFGTYRIDQVTPGQTYVIRASAKRYLFDQQMLQINGNLTNVDFVGIN